MATIRITSVAAVLLSALTLCACSVSEDVARDAVVELTQDVVQGASQDLVDQDVELARQGVAKFHASMRAGRFEQIRGEADESLRASETNEAMTRLLSEIVAKTGAPNTCKSLRYKRSVTETSNLSILGATRASEKFVTIDCVTEFENAVGAEAFVFRILDGKARLSSYRLTSNALSDTNDGAVATFELPRPAGG